MIISSVIFQKREKITTDTDYDVKIFFDNATFEGMRFTKDQSAADVAATLRSAADDIDRMSANNA